MTRPTKTQLLLVCRMSKLVSPEMCGVAMSTLLAADCTPEARAQALQALRSLGSILSRYCDEYESAAASPEACHG